MGCAWPGATTSKAARRIALTPPWAGVRHRATLLDLASSLVCRLALEPKSERDVCAQADHKFILDLLRWIVWVRDPAPRIDDVLEVGLNLPPLRNLYLIGCLEKSLSAAHGRVDRRLKDSQIPVKGCSATADERDANAKAEHIVVASRDWVVQGKAAVDAERDAISILERREHRPDED